MYLHQGLPVRKKDLRQVTLSIQGHVLIERGSRAEPFTAQRSPISIVCCFWVVQFFQFSWSWMTPRPSWTRKAISGAFSWLCDLVQFPYCLVATMWNGGRPSYIRAGRMPMLEGQPASMHIGERSPVASSTYASSSLTTGSTAASSTTIPQIHVRRSGPDSEGGSAAAIRHGVAAKFL